jgi:hypothetical protein
LRRYNSCPADSVLRGGMERDGGAAGTAFDPASIPVVPLIAYFVSRPVMADGGTAANAGPS